MNKTVNSFDFGCDADVTHILVWCSLHINLKEIRETMPHEDVKERHGTQVLPRLLGFCRISFYNSSMEEVSGNGYI